MNELLIMPATVEIDLSAYNRGRTLEYDNLHRVTLDQTSSNEPGTLLRDFTYAYETAAGKITRTGPDGVDTVVTLDAVGRVGYMRRGPQGNSVAEVAYEYYENDLLHRATFHKPDGMPVSSVVEYDYFDNGLVRLIEHHNHVGLVIWSYGYTYDDIGAPASITEYDPLGRPTFVTEFSYDIRGRLIEEKRYDDTLQKPIPSGLYEYWYRYVYDSGGNRTHKFDDKSAREWRYTYDLDDPVTYQTANNRLMMAVEYAGQGGGADESKTTWYVYNSGGNVTRIVSRDEVANGPQNMAMGGGGETELEGAPEPVGELEPIGGGGVQGFGFPGGECPNSTKYAAVRFGYAANGKAVTHALGEEWCNDNGLGCQDQGTYKVNWAREFRNDGTRQRYLDRELDPTDLTKTKSETLTHYGGKSPYWSRTRMYNPDGSTQSETTTGYELGIARIDDPNGTPSTDYYHTDMLGTTRFLVDSSGAVVEPATYTAFGELVDSTSGRFGYVGTHGYQTHDEMPYQHVGARYYDPTSGRFLQRDPIGIRGGANVYAYVRGRATTFVDPSGLDFYTNVDKGAKVGAAIGGTAGGIVGGIGGASAGGFFGSIPGAAAGWAGGTAGGAASGAAAGGLMGALCGAWYTVGELATPLVDWIYSDDFAELAKPFPGRFSGGAGGSW